MDCPICKGIDTVMNEQFDDGFLYSCTACGHDVTREIEDLMLQEELSENDEEYYLDRISGTEGDDLPDPVSGVGGVEAGR